MKRNPQMYPTYLRLLPSLSCVAGLLFLLLWFSLAPAGAENDQYDPAALGRISGVVTDLNGQPLEGITISLINSSHSESQEQITTTKTGGFQILALFPGVYWLRADDPKKVFASQYFTATNQLDQATDIIVNGDVVTGIQFFLQPAGQLTGKVSLAGESAPIVSNVTNYASIYVHNADGLQFLETTEIISSTGVYTFNLLLPFIYRICANIYLPSSGGYANTCYGGIDLQSAADITVTSGITLANIDFDIDQGQFEGVIGGQVSVAGGPIANIRVDLQGSTQVNTLSLYTMTNEEGHYEFHGLPAGTYSALFTDPADRYPRIWHDLQPAGPDIPSLYYQKPIQLLSREVLSNVNVNMVEYGGFQGKVFRDYPRLVSGEQITVHLSYLTTNSVINLVRFVQVDESGHYSVTRLFPGAYTVGFDYCYSLAGGTLCIYRYFGANPPDFTGKPVMVRAGEIITGIDSLIGLDPVIYLPLVTK